MSAANIVYLSVVMAAYIAFMIVLGGHWLRQFLGDVEFRSPKAEPTESAREAAEETSRKAA